MLEVHVCNRRGAVLRAFAVGDRGEVIVGRDPHCDIRIDARDVSPEHCTIERGDGSIMLRDLESAFGTYINGGRVDQVRVIDGLEVRVGPALLRFYDTRH